MRILMGLEDPLQGFAEYGSSSVKANYYAQNQADALDLTLTVLETVHSNAPVEVSVTDIRTLLGQFMFKGDDVYKKVGVLSGGEKARVALCKMMLEPANLLLLDEVCTNHVVIMYITRCAEMQCEEISVYCIFIHTWNFPVGTCLQKLFE